MEVIVAKTAGFCFGVKRAVEQVYEQIEKAKKPVYTYGPIIHNEFVVKDLEEKGVRVLNTEEELAALKDGIVIIRSHGVGKHIYELLEAHHITVVDATCPFVKKIHSIVKRESELGKTIVIAGNPHHPEVMGIRGRCSGENVFVVNSEEEAEALEGQIMSKNVVLVAQTTLRKDFFKKIAKILKKHFTNAEIFDTICSATNERQLAAAELAEEADAMIVVGGAESSNTKKLYELCREHCTDTVCIENAKELNKYIKQGKFPASKKLVGITAGASTPGAVIKEVYLTMAENNEMNFAEAVEETLKPIKSGEVVKGVVIGITPTEVRVDIGNKYDGVIPFSELTDDSNADINELVKLGEEVEVYVVLVSDRDGVVTLSKKKIDAVKGMEEIRKAFESGEILTGRVLELVKGGVVSIVKGVRVFIPASECAERFLADLGVLLGTEQRFRIIKMDEDRRGRQRVVGSIKSVAKEESEKAAAEFWANAEVGKKYTGKVKSLTSFGAFVDLGGVDGLVHISELSWNRIKHPSEVVKAGDEITVYIKDMNKETGKVSLGYKKEEDSPWVQATKDLKVGDVIKCKIVRILPFGAFAEVAPYVDGLIHVSQISNERIDKPSDVLAIGDEVETKIVEINDDTKQIGLSMKALMTTDDSADEAPEEVEATSYTEDSSFTLGDILDAAEATEDADNRDAE